MFKKCLYFFLSVLFLQNACFAGTEALKRVNQEYMALMLGAEGILHQKATPEQINQMIDGCITAGITDRLYSLGNKSAMFQEQIAKFTGYQKLDVELAYAFYMLGYTKDPYEQLKQSLGVPLQPNFDHEFMAICAQVSPKGVDILKYTNRLEDVIRRTSKPLRFDDFVEIENRPSSGTVTPVTTRSFKSMGSSLTLKQNVRDSDAYKILIVGRTHEEVMQMLGHVVNECTELEEGVPPAASLASLAFSAGEEKAERIERYYRDDEIEALDSRAAGIYRTKMSQGKTAEEIVAILKRMGIIIAPKYEGE